MDPENKVSRSTSQRVGWLPGALPAMQHPAPKYRCLRDKRPSQPYEFIGFGAMDVTKSYTCTYTTPLRVIKTLGEGGQDPKRVRTAKRKTMQKTPREIVLNSNRSMESNVFVVAICVNQFGIVNAWATARITLAKLGRLRESH